MLLEPQRLKHIQVNIIYLSKKGGVIFLSKKIHRTPPPILSAKRIRQSEASFTVRNGKNTAWSQGTEGINMGTEVWNQVLPVVTCLGGLSGLFRSEQ